MIDKHNTQWLDIQNELYDKLNTEWIGINKHTAKTPYLDSGSVIKWRKNEIIYLQLKFLVL